MVWNLRTLLLAVAVAAAILGVFRGFWDSTKTNHHLLLGLYLVVVTSCAIAAIPRNASFRGGLLGTSVFGTLYFVTSLKAGYGLKLIYDSQALAANTKTGFALLGVAFLLSQLLTTLLWPPKSHGSSQNRRLDQ